MANVIALNRQARTADQVTEILNRYTLTYPQRLAVRAIMSTATRTEALALLDKHGIQVDRTTLYRWLKKQAFREALAHAEAAFAAGITKANLLRKSEAVLESAMEGTPILGYVGKDEQEIVGYKKDLPTAARLIETQGKLIGAFADENATKIAILVDVDFSGRKESPPDLANVREAVDGEFVEVPPDEGGISQSRPTGSGLASSGDSWLD